MNTEEQKIRIIIQEEPIDRKQLKQIAEERYGDMVKAVVDIEREIIAIGGEFHSDEEAKLLENESEQQNLWGINLYPNNKKEEFIEFDSIINIRPKQGNRSRSVKDEKIQEKIILIISNLICDEHKPSADN